MSGPHQSQPQSGGFSFSYLIVVAALCWVCRPAPDEAQDKRRPRPRPTKVDENPKPIGPLDVGVVQQPPKRTRKRKTRKRPRRRAPRPAAVSTQYRVGWGRDGDGVTGRNDRISKVGPTLRVPIEGFSSIKQHFSGGQAGRAIVLVPSQVRFDAPVAVLVHLHGFNNGFRDRGDGPRDIEWARLPEQLEASGRPVIAVLPQGTHKSGFAATLHHTESSGFDVDALLDEVREALEGLRITGRRLQLKGVILSGHSGGGNPIVGNLSKGHGLSPSRYPLLGVLLLDGINGQRRANDIAGWMRAKIAQQAAALRRIRTRRGRSEYLRHQPGVVLSFAAQGGYARRYGTVAYMLERDLEALTGGRRLRSYSREAVRNKYRVDPCVGRTHGTIVGDGKRGMDGATPYLAGSGAVERALTFILL